MALTPLTPRLTPTTSRITSVNMDYPTGAAVGGGVGDQPPTGGQEGEDGLVDMELMHNFGEGVGVDMRDFAVQGGDEDGDGVVDVLGDGRPKSEAGLETPPPMRMNSRPPTSATSNGYVKDAPTSDMDDMFHTETGLDGDDDDEDGDDTEATPGAKRQRQADVPGGFTYVDKDGESGRRKIRIEYIADKSRRHITFSKRKAGIMKKAYELSILTGTQVLLLVVSETGLVYTFTTTKLQPLVQNQEGKNLIQACLNAPDGYGPDGQPLSGPVPATNSKRGGLAIRPHKLTPSATAALAASAQAAQQHLAAEDAAHNGPIDPSLGIGQSTPVSQRPKKRLPSGRGKKAAAAAAAAVASDMDPNQHPGDAIPPVPPLPDMHRQSSPHGPPPSSMMQPLASPLSAGYHIPPEYSNHHTQSPTNPSFGYTHGGPGDYAAGYYTSPTSHGHPGAGYMSVAQAHAQGQQLYDAQQRERAMRMMDGQGTMGMGM